jgi:adenylate cyclase
VGVSLEAIRRCLEGVIPSTICTAAGDGTPNVTYLSVVHYVDPSRVALSFQFFNKTRANIAENPRAQLWVVDPDGARQYRLDLAYERTEQSGPVFERMNTRLTAIASLTGMSKVFRLRGADIYRVVACEEVPPGTRVEAEALPLPAAPNMEAVSQVTEALSACADLEALVTAALAGLRGAMGYEHVVMMLTDETGERLLTVDSQGAIGSGAGAEIPVGEGVWGTAAAERRPIRIAQLARDLRYSRAVRRIVTDSGDTSALETEIAWPGLERPLSLLAVPLVVRGELVGLLGFESARALRFAHDDETAVSVVARHLALQVRALASGDEPEPRAPGHDVAAAGGQRVRFRYHAEDDSVFIDDRYVIKGLSGRILHRLVGLFATEGRTTFSNKELRLDAQLRLSALRDNLETRLLLLRRRLDDRGAPIRLLRTGRGQLALKIDGLIEGVEIVSPFA